MGCNKSADAQNRKKQKPILDRNLQIVDRLVNHLILSICIVLTVGVRCSWMMFFFLLMDVFMHFIENHFIHAHPFSSLFHQFS